MSIENRRALNRYRRLLMARKMRNWWLVESSSSVYVYSIDHIVDRLGSLHRMRRLILPCRGKQQATIRSEGQAPKERSVSFIGVDARILDTHCH